MKSLLLLLALLPLISLLYGFDYLDSTDITGHDGRAYYQDSHLFLYQDGTLLRLLLAPQSTLDSLGFKPAEGDLLHVQGWLLGDKILVTKIYANDFDKLYWFRHDEGQPLFEEQSQIQVDPKKCLACGLCLIPCPTGAITMVKGKAYIDPEKCIECGICVDGHGKFKGCPFGAIKKTND